MWMTVWMLVGCSPESVPSKKPGGGASVGSVIDTGSRTSITTTPTAEGPLIDFTDGKLPRNILWLSIDTFRRDLFARYGGRDWEGETHMPFLDGLMSEGVVLDNVRQCSNWTGAGTSCTMAGRHGIEAGYEIALSAQEGSDFIPEDHLFVAEILQDRGWHTILFSTNGWLRAPWGNTQGFVSTHHVGGSRAGAVFDQAQVEVNAAPGDRHWFTHLHFYDPHAPYNPPEVATAPDGTERRYLRGLDQPERWELPWDLANRSQHYDARDDWGTLDEATQAELLTQLKIRYEAEVRYMDDMMSDAWARWDADGLLDDTLVVLWADHGEAFWEHGKQTHAWNLYGEETDVAMFLWSKNIKPKSFAGPASTIDLVPTLLKLYHPEQAIPDDVTGIPLDEIPEDRVRFMNANARAGVVQAAQRGTERIHFWWRTGELAVTDSALDAAELEDLYDPTDPRTLELWELLKPMVELGVEAIDTDRYPINWPEELP